MSHSAPGDPSGPPTKGPATSGPASNGPATNGPATSGPSGVRPGAPADSPAPEPYAAALGAAFVAVADTLDGGGAVGDVLVGRCVGVLGAAAAGLLLVAESRGSAEPEVVAVTDEAVRALVAAEGPGRECHRAGAPVRADVLGAAAGRWPDFTGAALAAGYGAVLAVPMRWREETIGALTLFRTAPGPLPDGYAELAQALADVTTIGVLQRRVRRQREQLADQLQSALESRVLVEQAKGLLAERWQVSVDAAFTALRSHARTRRIRLSDLAQGLLDSTVDAAELRGGPGR
ncbi:MULTISPECIES: GAF and ANTAR domain-containing protein [unclassified Streptomyces]|uniref:GAF and ANTAR domain-containing protein n=1 Tax=unclassified Streptomyces TaxID=2593676 RepID=UPI0033A37AC9